MTRTIRRLTFVSDAPHFGGAERYIIAMALAARRRDIEPHIHWQPTDAVQEDVFAQARTEGLDCTVAPPEATRSALGTVRSMRRMLSDRQPDGVIINASGRPRYWLTPWQARLADVPAVWVHQMVDACDHRQLPPRWFGGRMEGPQYWRVPQTVRHRLAAAGAAAVVALNAEDRERIARWQGVARDKIRVIPHGLDCERFRYHPRLASDMRRVWGIDESHRRRPFIIGTASRLSGEKGVDLLIEATALLRHRGVEVLTVIAGQGPDAEPLAELARQRGVKDAVRFLDFVADMPAFYSALDVFVMPSRTESFGLALAEAMACKRPVVATPTSGSMRQIEHRVTGWQLDTFSPLELATAIATLRRDHDLRNRMHQPARDSVVRQFSIDLTLERTIRALRGAARRQSPLRWPGMDQPPFVTMAAEDLA